MRRATRMIPFLGAALVAAGLALAADPPAGPVQVTNFGKKAPVTFDHAQHAGKGVTCENCHHNAGDGKFKCGECHKAEAEGSTPKLQDAIHAKDVGKCWSCHRSDEGAKKMKCNECHKE